jgi:hypothetical protein
VSWEADVIALLLKVCLAAAPAECRDIQIPFDGPMAACCLHGQFTAAEWISSHPGYRIAEWRCGPVEREV